MSRAKRDAGAAAIMNALQVLSEALAATNSQTSTHAKGGSIAVGRDVHAKRIAIDNRCVIHLHLTLPMQGPQA